MTCINNLDFYNNYFLVLYNFICFIADSFLDYKEQIKIKNCLIFNLLKLFLPNLKQNSCLISKRRGIKWSLDLSEGIDLSIYVFGCFEKKQLRP